ncbi:LysR family transcriptional regulator [Paenibacillus albicereus]|uniref:LysR family transcriptional regulator n=1 Tax=Paenibacillus albicereus TaxID=2726185 RepID=A0A6H2GXK0_9BACL|nr:LysR substrate-binding domain-containing protein [Paenibacillus albicereus]QJC52112.1 LysR family transcriptional regulator [Paenibacillus albicereus]
MSLFKYEVLSTVVELGSLTRAGETLGLTQSGVSHAISSLEKEFGLALLTRSRSGIRLTESGERLLRPMRELLAAQEQLKQEIALLKGLQSGTVRLGTFTSVSVHWLPAMIKAFDRDYPGIELKLIEGDYRDIEEGIADGSMDLGFLSLPSREGLDTLPLKKDRMLFVLPPDHPLAAEPRLSLSQLEDEVFIIPKEGSDYDVRRILEESIRRPRIKYETHDDYAIIAMVEHGLGISILPELVLRGRDHRASMVELEDGRYRTLGIAAASFKLLSPAAKRFMDYIQEYVGSLDA